MSNSAGGKCGPGAELALQRVELPGQLPTAVVRGRQSGMHPRDRESGARRSPPSGASDVGTPPSRTVSRPLPGPLHCLKMVLAGRGQRLLAQLSSRSSTATSLWARLCSSTLITTYVAGSRGGNGPSRSFRRLFHPVRKMGVVGCGTGYRPELRERAIRMGFDTISVPGQEHSSRLPHGPARAAV